MPRVMYPHLLRAVYNETTRLIEARKIPTELVHPSIMLFRGFDQQHAVINTQGVFPRHNANAALTIRDQFGDSNRFSGQSFMSGIPAYGGLYCSMQGQAIVNEMRHYARMDKHIPRSPLTGFPNVDGTLRGKCIVRIRLMSSVLAADISDHNPGSPDFFKTLDGSPEIQAAMRASGRGGRSVQEQLKESEDCSTARGIGLAVAKTPWLKALKATTVRLSDRPDEMGDNLVFFGQNDQKVPTMWIDEAYFFPLIGTPMTCPVEFAPNT